MENINNTNNISNTINKPISLLINEFRQGLVDYINNSNLHPEFKDMILEGIYTEVHQVAITQANYEKAEYEKALAKQSTQELTFQ